MAKVITRSIHERLDTYMSQEPIKKVNSFTQEQSIPETNKNKKVLKKNDGLIEKIGEKTFITEDNRQLLND